MNDRLGSWLSIGLDYFHVNFPSQTPQHELHKNKQVFDSVSGDIPAVLFCVLYSVMYVMCLVFFRNDFS